MCAADRFHSAYDSRLQGRMMPADVYLEAAYQAKVHAEDISELLRISKRLIKRAQDQMMHGRRSSGEMAKDLEAVRTICRRFDLIARQLLERHQDRETLRINDEYNVQDLLHAVLRLHFDDVRPEEWTPSFGGAASRMDFLLKAEKICCRMQDGSKGKSAGEQLITADISRRYKAHPDCDRLVYLVYNPQHVIKNPPGLEKDLNALATSGTCR